ncbi:PadR family transcriptional regulator [Cohnella cellulosilytica]|uniref:PadR family transcriptional regulator n=1 Tax=Cohnella cellulosilytica TaxID=986710 RepID=A0ABW2FFJ7_9BACL
MSIRLIILGLLMENNRHPYEIRQTIKARNWHMTFRIRDGSLYYAVDQMREDGLIEVAETIPVQGDNRPDKIVYRITDKGKDALRQMVHEEFDKDFYPQHPIFAPLVFARHADNAEMETLIAKRLTGCQDRIDRINGVLELKGGWLPHGSKRMIEGVLRFSEAERDWLAVILEDARNGLLKIAERKPGSPPDGERC